MTDNTSNIRRLMDRTELIQCSLRCFARGCLGLLPGFGLPFAIMAMMDYSRMAVCRNSEWNPAERHLAWGMGLAGLGLFMTLLLVLFAISTAG